MAMDENRDVIFEITEEIGVITEHPTGWNKEINMVSWNGNSAKYDIRDWSPDHAQMGRGITLHEKEMRMMLDEELARAFVFGDGRDGSSDDKINELNIRPIISDEKLYISLLHQTFPEHGASLSYS